jgi:hypothetical protein
MSLNWSQRVTSQFLGAPSICCLQLSTRQQWGAQPCGVLKHRPGVLKDLQAQQGRGLGNDETTDRAAAILCSAVAGLPVATLALTEGEEIVLNGPGPWP